MRNPVHQSYCCLLFLLLNSFFMANAQHLVKGTVVDENNRPLPSVNIFLESSKKGTITNANGGFSVSTHLSEEELTASFVGYRSFHVVVTPANSVLHIRLQPLPVEIDEVIVTNLTAAQLLRKALAKIKDNYRQEPFLLKLFYRARLEENDSVKYIEETAFDIIKNYDDHAKDRYFLRKNRHFWMINNYRGFLKGTGVTDGVKQARKLFDSGFFKKYRLNYLPSTFIEDRRAYVIEMTKGDAPEGTTGKLYIDVEDLAFVRIEIYDEKGHESISQYKKVGDKYYLVSGKRKYINRKLGRTIPATGEFTVTEIIHPFAPEDIEGYPIDREDILSQYATQDADTSFWEDHAHILQDEDVSRLLKQPDLRKEISFRSKPAVDPSDMAQYAYFIKRLYTPQLAFRFSSDGLKDFSSLNFNLLSINNWINSEIHTRMRNSIFQFSVSALYHSYIMAPMEETLSENLFLSFHGIRSRMMPTLFNRYKQPYLYHVDDNAMSTSKSDNYTAFMRLHTVRDEGHYVRAFQIEEELAKTDLRNHNNLLDYLMIYAMDLFVNRNAIIYSPSLKDISPIDKKEREQPLLIDRKKSWVKYLFEQDAVYDRHITRQNLTDEEQRYLKRSSWLSWINLLSPQMFGIPKFRLGARNSVTFSLNYLRVPFGEMFGQNIWLMHHYGQLHGIFVKQYRNFDKTTWGIGYKLYDVQLSRNFYVTSSLIAWQQPTAFAFKTDSSFSGFSINQLFEYQLLPDKYTNRNNLSLFLGYDYKTKGYMPESYYLNPHFQVKAGLKVRLK